LVDTLDIPVEATEDIDTLREWLWKELGKDFSREGAEKLWGGVTLKFDVYPQVNIKLDKLVMYRGTTRQYTTYRYRDITRHRWISAESARRRVENWRLGLPWGI